MDYCFHSSDVLGKNVRSIYLQTKILFTAYILYLP